MSLITGIAQLPGFAESMRLLVERERYSDVDIAMMFGVSHQRIRQLLQKLGLRGAAVGPAGRGLFAVRVWDDSAHCFRPVPRGEIRRNEQRLATAKRRTALTRTQLSRRARVIDAINEFRAAHGCEPSRRQLVALLGGNDYGNGYMMHLVHLWRLGRRGSTAEVLADLRAATGWNPSDMRGVANRARSLGNACRRGHPYTPENTYVYRTSEGCLKRQCRTCKRRRSLVSAPLSCSDSPSA